MRLRVPLLFVLFAAAPTVAHADSCPVTTACEAQLCHALAAIPTDARIDTPKIAARVSTAMCAAGRRMDAVKVRDNDASLMALQRAVAPTLAILDDLARVGTPDWQIIASHLRGELFVAMTVRVRNAIPPATPTMSVAARTAWAERHDRIERAVAPWLADASLSYERVHDLAAEHHYSTNNPVVAAAVRQSATEIVARVP